MKRKQNHLKICNILYQNDTKVKDFTGKKTHLPTIRNGNFLGKIF